MTSAPPLVLLVVSRKSGAGKTTLICALVAELIRRGVRVAAVKRSHHDIDLDLRGKDSGRIRDAGASVVALAGPSLVTLFADGGGRKPRPTPLADIVRAISALTAPDLVIVEGGRSLRGWPRIEVVGSGQDGNRTDTASRSTSVVAIAADHAVRARKGVPVLPRSDARGFADVVVRLLAERRAATSARPARRRPSKARPSKARPSAKPSATGTPSRQR